MKTLEELKKTPNLCVVGKMDKGTLKDHQVYQGWVEWPGFRGTVIFGYEEGKGGAMEHVSVSHRDRKRLPTWEEMVKIKAMFFYPNEMVVQIHPDESRYLHGVGGRENILHLWRPKDGDFSILNHPEVWD